jgi:hypothetical protein
LCWSFGPGSDVSGETELMPSDSRKRLVLSDVARLKGAPGVPFIGTSTARNAALGVSEVSNDASIETQPAPTNLLEEEAKLL